MLRRLPSHALIEEVSGKKVTWDTPALALSGARVQSRLIHGNALCSNQLQSRSSTGCAMAFTSTVAAGNQFSCPGCHQALQQSPVGEHLCSAGQCVKSQLCLHLMTAMTNASQQH